MPSGKGAQRKLRLETLESKRLLAGDTYADPDGGWAYIYEGEGDAEGPEYTSLDGTWDHDNGSDQWDGSKIGEGNPGGVIALEEDDTTFLRMQDPGDPRDHGNDDPGSNRKVYFTHLLSSDFDEASMPDNLDFIVDEGVTLHFRARVATRANGPLDNMRPDGGTEAEAWPEDGLGYYQHNGGKSMIAIKQVDGPNVAFGLARGSNVNEEFFIDADDNSIDGLFLPHLMQDVNRSNDSDPGNTPGTLSSEDIKNVVPVEEVTEWQEFWITIEEGQTEVDGFEDGTHIVKVYHGNSENPVEAMQFGITAAEGNDDDESYIAIGAGATPRAGAFDLDFFAWAPGVHEPVACTSCEDVPGDINGDKEVNFADFLILSNNFGQSVEPGTGGDFDKNGEVDFGDFLFFSEAFGT